VEEAVGKDLVGIKAWLDEVARKKLGGARWCWPGAHVMTVGLRGAKKAPVERWARQEA
jgi:hypothetical protein